VEGDDNIYFLVNVCIVTALWLILSELGWTAPEKRYLSHSRAAHYSLFAREGVRLMGRSIYAPVLVLRS